MATPKCPVPIREHWMNDQSYSTQQELRLLAVHTAEGALTDESLAAFCDRMNDRSYHDGCDDDSLTRMVTHSRSAWHLRGGNPLALGLCLMGFAKWTRTEWLRHKSMLLTAAWWIEKESFDHKIPLVKLTSSQVGKAVQDRNYEGGVCGHIDYTKGTGDGTHWDPGYNFPWDHVMASARKYREMRLDEVVSEDDKNDIANLVVKKLFAHKLDDLKDADDLPDSTYAGIVRYDWKRSREHSELLKEIKEGMQK